DVLLFAHHYPVIDTVGFPLILLTRTARISWKETKTSTGSFAGIFLNEPAFRISRRSSSTRSSTRLIIGHGSARLGYQGVCPQHSHELGSVPLFFFRAQCTEHLEP